MSPTMWQESSYTRLVECNNEVRSLGRRSCHHQIDEPGPGDTDSADLESKDDSSEDDQRDIRMSLSPERESLVGSKTRQSRRT